MRTRSSARLAASTLAVVVAISSCTSDDGSSTDRPTSTTGRSVGGVGNRFASRYEEFGSCDDLLSWAREQMLARVTPYGLDGWYGWPRLGVPVMEGDVAESRDDSGAGAEAVGAPSSAGGGTSQTNTQEVGVDEGDVAETDGRFIYTIVGGMLRSVDLDTATVVSELDAPPGASQMILSGGRLAVVGQDWSSPSGDTVVSLYAVDAGVLTPLGRTHLEGNLVAVRSIDRALRVVVDQPFATRLPFVQPRTGTSDEEEQALEQNRAVIRDATVEQLLPRTYSEGPTGGSTAPRQALPCEQVGHPAEFSGLSTTWVATFDLDGSDASASGAAGVIAAAQTVYASGQRLYVATMAFQDQTSDTIPVTPPPPTTAIHAFDLAAPDGADYLASGEVDGTVLSSYALSEHEDLLRIATTTSSGGFGQSQESGVHVFEVRGDELIEIGSVGGLGRTETIQGVRFVGDLGYVVTFRQTDPLYVIDLSVPTAPVMRGELKVPGFSTYLHPLDNGQLLAIGYEGTETGQITGTQLSLFDVNDPGAPQLLDTLPVGDSSEAAFDPHAFLYWPDTSMVVVPADEYCEKPVEIPVEPSDPNAPRPVDLPVVENCSAALVGQVADGQLSERGRLASDHSVRRTMIANGRLVTVSDGGVAVYAMDTLEKAVEVPFS